VSASFDRILEQLADLVAERVAQRLSADAKDQAAAAAPSQPEFLSESALATQSGISRRTLQGWRARGTGPRWAKVGRRVLYPRADADQFLKNGSGARAS
jgi:hypothetical protein